MSPSVPTQEQVTHFIRSDCEQCLKLRHLTEVIALSDCDKHSSPDTYSYEYRKQLVVRWLRLEASIVDMKALRFVLPDIARALMHCGYKALACAYALTGIELNERAQDANGVIASASILLNLASSLEANTTAINLIEKYHIPVPNGFLLELQSQPSKGEDKMQNMLSTPRRAPCLAYCLSEELMERESAIRSVMRQKHILGDDAIH